MRFALDQSHFRAEEGIFNAQLEKNAAVTCSHDSKLDFEAGGAMKATTQTIA